MKKLTYPEPIFVTIPSMEAVTNYMQSLVKLYQGFPFQPEQDKVMLYMANADEARRLLSICCDTASQRDGRVECVGLNLLSEHTPRLLAKKYVYLQIRLASPCSLT